MNKLYIEKTPDGSWGANTDIHAIEKLLQQNSIELTRDKVDRMPESYIANDNNGTIQPDKK